jgi:hypothetical protein
MFSWATKKPGFPLPGEVQALYQSPLHEEEYMHFSGELPRGMYGAGKVTPQEKGTVIVHSAAPNKVVFTTGHTRYPQTFVMIRTGQKPTDWLIKNLTPKSLEEFAGPGAAFEKEHYKSAPASEVGKHYGSDKIFSEKIDGARMLLRLRQHHVDAASYRPSVTGTPIMHTERLQLPHTLKIPSNLVGTTLVGETYGERAPEKAGAYRDSRSMRKLIEHMKAVRGPVAAEPLTAHTGPNASSMLTGSDAPRLEQGLKMGELIEKQRKKKKMNIDSVMVKLQEKEHEAEQPAQMMGSASEKFATINGQWVEPPVAKHPIDVKDTQPKKPKKMEPDTRPLLQDKVAKLLVREVDGEKVRNTKDVEFTMGGHHLLHPFIPKREIWIDKALSALDKKMAEHHMRLEYAIMKAKNGKGKGKIYEMAHRVAANSEARRRAKHAQEAIPPQELGGILNASLAESLRKQREQKVRLRTAVFNILSKGKKPVGPEVPYPERTKMIQEILGHLPKDQFHMPEMATTPEAQKALFERIQAGKNPRTSEGVVVWPQTGVPTKIKLMPESDVVIRGTFSGEGKYQGTGVGGFEYSLPGSEKVLGRVGTGLSDELRAAMLKNQQDYIGRVARVRSMGQFPSGAHRAPSLIALHEEEPQAKTAANVRAEADKVLKAVRGGALNPGFTSATGRNLANRKVGTKFRTTKIEQPKIDPQPSLFPDLKPKPIQG